MGTTGYILRRFRAKIANRPTSFLWVQDNTLAASGYPASKSQVDWLGRQGVKRILTLTESPLPAEWVRSFEVRHIPMQDHQPPTVAALLEASTYVEDSIESKKPIVVHCLAGQGRTMCVVAAYLIKSKGMSVDDALRLLRRARPGAVEEGQEAALRDFASQVGEKLNR